MKKLILALVALAFGALSLASPASATGGGDDRPDADSKKITLCHATGSATNPYTKIEVSINGWYNGHRDHEGDIWRAFSYQTKDGDTITVPQQGNVNLLDHPNCQEPKQDTKIAKPEAVYVDKCETKNDVFSVAPGTGYTVGQVVQNTDGTQSITVTLVDGFAWSDGSKTPITFTRPGFTNVACDLPETGVGAQQYTLAGGSALAGLALAGFMFMRSRKVTA